MDELLNSVATRPEPWTVVEIVRNCTLAFLLALFVAWVYQKTHRPLALSFTFVNTLVLLSMVMALVIMVIGNNIARAFGLVGAMSIIRFRTVVKDTRDTAFVFFSLGTGMAAGTGNVAIAIVGTLLIGLFIGVLHWTRHGAGSLRDFLLTFERSAATPEGEDVHLPVFERYLRSFRLANVRSRRLGEFVSLTYHVRLRDEEEAPYLVRDLSAREGIQRVVINRGEEGET